MTPSTGVPPCPTRALEKMCAGLVCCFVIFLSPCTVLQVVKGLLTGRMRGVGDVLHQLELWGYRLNHVQCPADDFDYSVTSLKEDLR